MLRHRHYSRLHVQHMVVHLVVAVEVVLLFFVVESVDEIERTQVIEGVYGVLTIT